MISSVELETDGSFREAIEGLEISRAMAESTRGRGIASTAGDSTLAADSWGVALGCEERRKARAPAINANPRTAATFVFTARQSVYVQLIIWRKRHFQPCPKMIDAPPHSGEGAPHISPKLKSPITA